MRHCQSPTESGARGHALVAVAGNRIRLSLHVSNTLSIRPELDRMVQVVLVVTHSLAAQAGTEHGPPAGLNSQADSELASDS